MIIAYDGLCCQVEAQVGRVIFSELSLVLQSVSRCFLRLNVFEVVFAFSFPVSIVCIVVFGVTSVSIVHR